MARRARTARYARCLAWIAYSCAFMLATSPGVGARTSDAGRASTCGASRGGGW